HYADIPNLGYIGSKKWQESMVKPEENAELKPWERPGKFCATLNTLSFHASSDRSGVPLLTLIRCCLVSISFYEVFQRKRQSLFSAKTTQARRIPPLPQPPRSCPGDNARPDTPWCN